MLEHSNLWACKLFFVHLLFIINYSSYVKVSQLFSNHQIQSHHHQQQACLESFFLSHMKSTYLYLLPPEKALYSLLWGSDLTLTPMKQEWFCGTGSFFSNYQTSGTEHPWTLLWRKHTQKCGSGMQIQVTSYRNIIPDSLYWALQV